ncbi:hypothetical protein CspeluHIS016_0601350 [Cutaneotrichosporon spelunceum]|uniref:BHLH domain-containing protein n=1 Tax=Cutaneotrichosporon spelunceum TaxID=1672016 RepID=A0AAD3TXG8_9TREE|nr:hypothetical protein CspeluHIS016_0601350 [Cutaneotrichosporon spelunceum]
MHSTHHTRLNRLPPPSTHTLPHFLPFLIATLHAYSASAVHLHPHLHPHHLGVSACTTNHLTATTATATHAQGSAQSTNATHYPFPSPIGHYPPSGHTSRALSPSQQSLPRLSRIAAPPPKAITRLGSVAHPSRNDDLAVTPNSVKYESPDMAPIDLHHALDPLPMLNNSEVEDEQAKPQETQHLALSPAERRFLQTMPIPQRPVTAYPLDAAATYTWSAQQAAADATAAAVVAAGGDKRDGLAIDPALSAVRSSNDAAPGSTDVTMASAAPEIRLQPETLGSVPASPALDSNAEAAAAVAAVQALQAPDHGVKKETPFSRSPELRISHKLAERKRRKEMRDLFDELREQLPADRGMKASKWEILSKAVDYIQHLKNQVTESHRLLEIATRDLAIARGQTPETSTTTNTTWPPTYHTFNIPYVPHASTPAATAPAAPVSQQQVQASAPQPQPQPQSQPQPQTQAAVPATQPQAASAVTVPAPSQPQAQAVAATTAPAPAAAVPTAQPPAQLQAPAAAPQAVVPAVPQTAVQPQGQAPAPNSSST